jgi:hypothetical protein
MAMETGEAQRKIDAYIARLRKHLRGIDEQELREILEELRGHILEKSSVSGEQPTAVAVDRTLTSLGTPELLAGEYLTDNLLAQAEVSRSPLRLLQILFRWASLSAAGFFVFLGSIVGYFFGAALILCALLKPLHPQTSGLWKIPAGPEGSAISLRLGFGSPPSGASDLLGWWIIPIGLVVGCALVMLTTRLGLDCARHFRRSRKFPPL